MNIRMVFVRVYRVAKPKAANIEIGLMALFAVRFAVVGQFLSESQGGIARRTFETAFVEHLR